MIRSISLVARHGLRLPRRRPGDRTEVGVEVEDRRKHQRPGRAVDRGVVHLGQLGDLAAVVDALDHVQLPQRPARSSGRATMRLTASASCWGVPGGGDGVVADVEVDVEIGILDPVRQIEAERHLDQPTAKRSELVDALEDHLLGRLEAGTAGRAAGS